MDARLTRRERQLLEVLYRSGPCAAADVQEQLADGSSYSAVRALLRLMEEKGLVRHAKQGRRFVYRAARPPHQARRSALRSLLDTLCEGSVEVAVASLLDLESQRLDGEDLDRLEALIDEARRRRDGRKGER